MACKTNYAQMVARFSGARLTIRLYLLSAVCASRQEKLIPGALSILRELSLGRPVGFLTRRPPTL
ncbi:hypothetical protein MPLSOD_90140 [Mesorhizobium sp. SOD10]|nr:hypothetical protein MPLSOD_90140 [Mesorhizobium sp. SOD10]